MNILKDTFGRKFPYIRLSISDVCNFKCGYCLPNGYQVDKNDTRKFLRLDEIKRLANCFSELGVNKIRITGGEPTVRKDFFDIIKVLKFESRIQNVSITTNGYKLDKKAEQLVNSGLTGINISIDSLDREVFKNITGHDRLPEILHGIANLQSIGFENIKLNAVLLNRINSSIKDFNNWAKYIEKNKVDFRYIELMRTGDNLEYLKENKWIYQTFGKDAGPSLNYINPKYEGKFGIIAPYSKDFCKSCNRLRITSRGDLRLCLFGNTGINLRHLLQKDNQLEELKDLIMKQMQFKKESHYLELGDTGSTTNLSKTGG